MAATFRLTKATKTYGGKMLPASTICWVLGKSEDCYEVKSLQTFEECLVDCSKFDFNAIRIN